MLNDPFVIKETGNDIQDSNVGIFDMEIDGDIMTSNSYQKKISTTWKESNSIKVLGFVVLILFGVIFSKLYYLQIVLGAQYQGTAEGNRTRDIPLIPPRGAIIDSNGERLAYNVPDFAILITPQDLPKSQEEEDVMFKVIAETIGIDAFDLVESFANIPRSSSIPIELARGLTQEQTITLSRFIEHWQGIEIVPSHQRSYAYKESLSHILGYTGKISKQDYEYVTDLEYNIIEHVGKLGLEKSYQENLRGVLGKQIIEVDSFGKSTNNLSKTKPIVGSNLYLNIDSDLQQYAWNLLVETVEELESPGGSIVVLNPKNGAVLALVSYPGYNNELFSRKISTSEYEKLLNDKRRPLFHRAISGEYPSGSTIKLVVGSAALEEGIINSFTSILSTGGININKYSYPDWKYGGHGATNIVHALAESVNTFFYAIGGGYDHIQGLGVEKITHYGKIFGLASKTGIDLPSEKTGLLPSKQWKLDVKNERWYLGDTYHLAIGQGDILVTPLQIANVTSAIANNGTLYAPQIVDRIGRTYESAKKKEPIIINNNIISNETINIIQQGLRSAVTYGTAKSLSTLEVDIAGKTGTAQFNSAKPPHAWFTGFAPYKDPEIVITVLVEEGEGGDISATPIAKKIFERYFNE